jgi:hypothetical protein
MEERKVKGLAANSADMLGDVRAAPGKKEYVKPRIISCSAEEILDRLGSAKACSFSGGVTCNGPTDEFGLPAD